MKVLGLNGGSVLGREWADPLGEGWGRGKVWGLAVNVRNLKTGLGEAYVVMLLHKYTDASLSWSTFPTPGRILCFVAL